MAKLYTGFAGGSCKEQSYLPNRHCPVLSGLRGWSSQLKGGNRLPQGLPLERETHLLDSELASGSYDLVAAMLLLYREGINFFLRFNFKVSFTATSTLESSSLPPSWGTAAMFKVVPI